METEARAVGNPKVDVGDVYEFPVSADLHGFVQVAGVYKPGIYFFLVFEDLLSDQEDRDLRKIVNGPIAFAGIAMDAKIYVGDWQRVGSTPLPDKVPFPAYRVCIGGPDNVYVEDTFETRRRRATPEEARTLKNRSVATPAVLELALKSLYGEAPWKEQFRKYQPDWEHTVDRVFSAEQPDEQ
jgi:hypothetical protein